MLNLKKIMEDFEMIQVLVMVPYNNEVRADWEKRFLGKFRFIYKGVSELKKEDAVLKEAEIIIGEPPVELLTDAPNLKWLQTTSAGVDMYTKTTGFPERAMLTNATGVYGKIISEYVLGAILMRYRRFPEYMEQQKVNLWQSAGPERSLEGKHVLVLGTGDIGKNIARRLRAFDSYVVGIKRTTCESVEYFQEIDTLEHLKERLSEADIVIACLPGTKETEGILDYEHLSLLKKDAMLLNVGRGNLIVTEDLIRILNEGGLADVILDVEETEPLPESSALWTYRNVFITPHISGKGLGYAPETEAKIWQLCTENLERYAKGSLLKNQVDLSAGY